MSRSSFLDRHCASCTKDRVGFRSAIFTLVCYPRRKSLELWVWKAGVLFDRMRFSWGWGRIVKDK